VLKFKYIVLTVDGLKTGIVDERKTVTVDGLKTEGEKKGYEV
jgi:hypothetical protein